MQLVTPDGRYVVIEGRLWRVSNPHLPEEQRLALVKDLMTARRAVKAAQPSQTMTACASPAKP